MQNEDQVKLEVQDAAAGDGVNEEVDNERVRPTIVPPYTEAQQAGKIFHEQLQDLSIDHIIEATNATTHATDPDGILMGVLWKIQDAKRRKTDGPLIHKMAKEGLSTVSHLPRLAERGLAAFPEVRALVQQLAITVELYAKENYPRELDLRERKKTATAAEIRRRDPLRNVKGHRPM